MSEGNARELPPPPAPSGRGVRSAPDVFLGDVPVAGTSGGEGRVSPVYQNNYQNLDPEPEENYQNLGRRFSTQSHNYADVEDVVNPQPFPMRVAYPRQRPERPGETGDDYSSGASRLPSEVDSDSMYATAADPPTDRYGFYLPDETANWGPMDLTLLRRREAKWIHMLSNWEHFMDHQYDKVKSRARKGIPPALRARAWKFLCGAAFHADFSTRNKHIFEFCERQEGDPKVMDEIGRDLDRQFPSHEMFARSGKYGDGGKEDLTTLLKAYTIVHPEEGYCQGQAPVASVLLMHMPVRDAFYVFLQICHKYIKGYYSEGLYQVQLDGDILMSLLRKRHNSVWRHLQKHGIDAMLFTVEWFMCIYCRTLPWPTVLRIWDCFFVEGVKVIFRAALVILKNVLGTSAQQRSLDDMHSILMALRDLPADLVQEDTFLKKVNEFEIDGNELTRLHIKAQKLKATPKLKVDFQ